MAAPKEIVTLVERFERNLPEYQSNTYKEAQTRQEFINPFFKALGWDMENEQKESSLRNAAPIIVVNHSAELEWIRCYNRQSHNTPYFIKKWNAERHSEKGHLVEPIM